MRIECIECGAVIEVDANRGRPRYFCPDKCRQVAYRKCQANLELIDEYNAKRRLIRRQYQEARRTSRSLAWLRRRGMGVLHDNEWSVGDIAYLFEISETRVRQLLKKRGDLGA